MAIVPYVRCDAKNIAVFRSCSQNRCVHNDPSRDSLMANLVNLDAMILREDFATSSDEAQSFEKTDKITLRELGPDGFIGKLLRKPDFQRETNHWNPDQVVALLKCFVNGDLIPSVILWKSDRHFFVIDGGHRLSVLNVKTRLVINTFNE